MGPTAAGKTDLAIEIAKRCPVEIISVDSALVYQDMDIGTAKPSPEVLAEFPHHLINIIDPTERYSVGRFREDALGLMAEIQGRGKIPLLVGGTMMYFNGLQHGLSNLPQAEPLIREKLATEIKQYGLASLHARLEQLDPESATRIHINDPQRLQRALEVFEITGKTMTELVQSKQAGLSYRVIKLIVTPFDRRVLHQRIADRYQQMIESGFIDEVKRLYIRPDCHADLPAIRAVGYRQVWSFLAGEYDQDTLIEKGIIATRQMAKRQLTWCRAQSDGVWFDSGIDLPISPIMQFLQQQIIELST